jgi:L-alanine-DL-glutamate epimerase-like enolase superfamily enzyme
MIKVKLEEVERYERPMKNRLAFRFGVITVTGGVQAVIRARIRLQDGRQGEGVAAEALAAKWFEKSPQFTDEQNLDQLRQSLAIAVEHYKAHGLDTPFGLFAGTYKAQQRRGATLGLNPLVSSYGPALLDRAILDAVGKAAGQSFAEMIKANLPGIAATDLTPDIKADDLTAFLKGLKPSSSIDLRHTVGLVDPLTAPDWPAKDRVNDGLPETLEEVVSYYRGRYYKLKVAGDIKADLDRLARIAAVLDAGTPDYHATLDGNEQYDDIDGIVELWRKVGEAPALARLVKSTLFIEQPIKRGVALSRSVEALAKMRPVIIDESDGELASFPTALTLGYRGVSSKNCKGFYKSILNAARVAKLGHGYFMSAEDLTTLPGVSVQQDLALVSLLGMTHVERNAHHFVDGMSFAPQAEQQAFVAVHPELYEMKNGHPARLKAPGGKIALGSLGVPGFAVGTAPDFKSMRTMAGVTV